jgi:hypothetical protein
MHGTAAVIVQLTMDIARPRDEAGEFMMEPEDELRFLVGRDGDHLVTPFQCDLCHF